MGEPNRERVPAMKLTADEIRAMNARHDAEEDQWLAGLRENPEFSRGGFPLSGDPSKGRVSHIDVGNGVPHCTECGASIFGDANWLPDHCPVATDERHVYPNGEKAPRSPIQQAVADLIEDPEA